MQNMNKWLLKIALIKRKLGGKQNWRQRSSKRLSK
jgi:hypothetical protein